MNSHDHSEDLVKNKVMKKIEDLENEIPQMIEKS